MPESLFSHQIRAVERAVQARRLLIVRPFGSGKTCIGLFVAQRLYERQSRRGLWIGPAHLLPQVQREAEKWGLTFPIHRIEKGSQADFSRDGLHLVSYARLRLSWKEISRRMWNFALIDEVHHAKDVTTWNRRLLQKLSGRVSHFVGLTGSPFQNGPHEFFRIVSLFSPRDLFWKLDACLQYKRQSPLNVLEWIRWKFFGYRPNRGPITGIKEPDSLFRYLAEYVDFADLDDIASECSIPRTCEQIITVELVKKEVELYRKSLKERRSRLVRDFCQDELDDSLISKGFRQITELRQLLLSNRDEPSTKTRKLCQDIASTSQNCSSRILVFSNFVERGIYVIAQTLKTLNVDYAIYTGDQSSNAKRKLLQKFFDGAIRVLLLSPVGFEGLDLLGTTHILIADPHYNPEVTRQLVARATRIGSPVQEVQVWHYVATSSSLKQGTVDEAILRIANRKARLNAQLRTVLSGSR